jgi:hypothetical protein
MWLSAAIAAVYLVSGIGLLVTFHHLRQHVWSGKDDKAMLEWAARHPQSGPTLAP